MMLDVASQFVTGSWLSAKPLKEVVTKATLDPTLESCSAAVAGDEVPATGGSFNELSFHLVELAADNKASSAEGFESFLN